MKKKLFSFLIIVLAILLLPVYASASEPQLYNVSDAADILTDEEDLRLEEMAAGIAEKYGIGVYIVTVGDFRDFDDDDVYEATYGIYHEYTMGEGDDRSGIMLLLSMAERDFAIFRYGERAEYVFTPYGMEKLEDSFLPPFAKNDWYGGFKGYIEACENYLALAAEGHPVRKSPAGLIIVFSAAALILAAVVVLILYGKMRSVRKASAAATYVAGALELTQSTDTFTHRTESRRKIESRSSLGGGSSGHSVARTGGGGAGRSGKF